MASPCRQPNALLPREEILEILMIFVIPPFFCWLLMSGFPIGFVHVFAKALTQQLEKR